MAASTSVRLVIPSEIKLVDLVHSTAEKMAELAGFGDDDTLNVGLAVREAVINAIVHGNRHDSSLKVHLTMSAGPRGLQATVRDHGEGFEPKSTPDPTSVENLLRTSGRGLLLIRAFVDDVKFRRHGKRGMEIILKKKRSPDSKDSSESNTG